MIDRQIDSNINRIPDIARIRFMTSHPKDLSARLIEVMKLYPRICRHVHLPVQSGSNKILELMNVTTSSLLSLSSLNDSELAGLGEELRLLIYKEHQRMIINRPLIKIL
jgi:hypothetical protein